jgi:hypothetical protein
METSHSGFTCRVCMSGIGSCYLALFGRMQKVSSGGKQISVVHELMESFFCSELCWEGMEKVVTEGLNPVYQPFHMVATCSQCGKAVDRVKPHYTLHVAEFKDVSEPWLISAQVLDEREIAVYCSDCMTPDEGESVEDELKNWEGAPDAVTAVQEKHVQYVER